MRLKKYFFMQKLFAFITFSTTFCRTRILHPANPQIYLLLKVLLNTEYAKKYNAKIAPVSKVFILFSCFLWQMWRKNKLTYSAWSLFKSPPSVVTRKKLFIAAFEIKCSKNSRKRHKFRTKTHNKIETNHEITALMSESSNRIKEANNEMQRILL